MIADVIISYYFSFMKPVARRREKDELLQVQIPASTKRHLAHQAIDTRETVRLIVLRALEAYGVPVPADAIADRRRKPRV